MQQSSRGVPILGCVLHNEGANFGIFSTEAEEILLFIYKDSHSEIPIDSFRLTRVENTTGDIFHIFIKNIVEGMAYEWYVINDKKQLSTPVLDPYAYATCERKKGTQKTYLGVVVKTTLAKRIKPIPWEDTIIYEMHVGAFTKHPTSKVIPQERGSFKAACEKIPYLKELGITTLELLPVMKWYSNTIKNVHPVTGEKLEDRWGYNTIGFFAVEDRYSTTCQSKDALIELKDFIDKAHDNGLEVLLDVVYNHTGEGGEGGAKINFKLLANDIYYKWNKQDGYLNCSGTGNTLNTNHYVVKKMIIDSLCYWVMQFGVDGFRFDLAPILGQDEEGRWMAHSLLTDIMQHPILSHVKLIAESWDAKGSYDVGRMPFPFREWSDYFRDTVRKFVKGDQGLTRSMVDCLLGTEIYFSDNKKGETHTIHFITAHDGFTMWDLVSYNNKHNEGNGENNQDGNNANYSYNCGIEGDTDDPEILKERIRKIKNFLCILFLSKGIPMLLMGDERGRSQEGNNNAFCQDNESVWMNWEETARAREIYLFTKNIITYRKKLQLFQSTQGIKNKVSWHGVYYNKPDWAYYSRSIACLIEREEEKFYAVFNNYHEPLDFELPPSESKWLRIIDTYKESPFDFIEEGIVIQTASYTVQGYSTCVFQLQKRVTSK